MAKRGNREYTDPHVLVAWVKEICRLCGRTSRSGSISFTIRTSRMGSVTALVASLPLHLVHHPREADGVSTVVYKDETLRRWEQ